MCRNYFSNQKGVTIIALVITIIVLLILAGISIAMFTSNDIVDTAFESKVVTELNQLGEEVNKIKVQGEQENLQDGIYSGSLTNDTLVNKQIIISTISINSPSIKLGIIDISKFNVDSTLGNNYNSYTSNSTIDNVTDLKDVYAINLETNDIYYINEKIYALNGIVEPDELISPIVTTDGPTVSLVMDNVDSLTDLKFTISVNKGKDNIDLKEDSKYEYYLSTRPNDIVGGDWSTYINDEELSVEKIGSREYYIFVRPVEDKNDNLSTAIGSNSSDVLVDGQKYHRFGPYSLNNGSILIINPNGGKYKNSSEKTTIKGKNNNSIIINSNDITPGDGFTVSFDSNGGTTPNSSIVSDKHFKDWSFSGSGSFKDNVYTFGKDTGTLTANYENASISLPSASRTGYTFVGWYDAATNGKKIGDAGSKYVPEKDITLYAYWNINNYTATFDSNGGTAATPSTITKKYGEQLGTLPTTSRTGYTFVGWFTEATDGNQISESTTMPINGATYYAHWSINQYTLTVKPNGGTWNNTTSNSTFRQNYGSTKTIANPTAPTGYTVTFNTNGGNSIAKRTSTKSFDKWSLSGKGKLEGTTFTFGDGDTTLSASYKNNSITLPTPTKTGYTFVGWYTDSALTKLAGKGGSSYTPKSTITLYAKWSTNQYKIDLNFNVNGTKYDSGYNGRIYVGLRIDGDDKGYIADYNDTHPYGTTWEIYGLRLDGVDIAYSDEGTLDASNLDLTKSFYIISFRANNGFGSVSPTSLIVPDNNTRYSSNSNILTLSDGRKVTATARNQTGYTIKFTNWSSPAGSITGPNSIIAYFNATKNSYTATFNSNGGTPANPSTITKTYGEQLGSLPTTSKTGYTFLGWYTSPTSGTQISTTTTMPATNITYYAHWRINSYKLTVNPNKGTWNNTTANTIFTKEYGSTMDIANPIPPTGYTVTFNTNGGNSIANQTSTKSFDKWSLSGKGSLEGTTFTFGDGDATLTANYKNNSITLPTPAKTGHTFAGWYTDSALNNKAGGAGEAYTPTANITLYAKWTANNYYIDLNLNVDGKSYGQGYEDRILIGLKINDVDKGYVKDYYQEHPYGTKWEIYGLRLDGVDVSYSDSGTLGASNLNLTKSFYTITFKVNNNDYGSVSPTSLIVPNNNTKYTTSSNTLTLGDGRKVTATVKNASGYTTTFASWSPASGTITDATTVTANFDRTTNSYTAKFDSNGGTTATPATITKKYGEQLGTLPTTSRTGYTFVGWFTAASGGTQISTSTTMPVNGATYYAHWNINQYTLTVNPNGGTWNNTTSNSTFKQNYGSTKAIANPTVPKGYTVTFNTNGGNSIANQTSTKSFDKWSLSGKGSLTGTTFTFGAGDTTLTANYRNNSITLPTPTKTGYAFGGWYTDSALKNEAGGAGEAYTPTANITLYAKWTVNNYKIDLNFNVNGTAYNSGYNDRIYVGLRIDGTDKGYVKDYNQQHPYGTKWEIYGLRLDGVDVSYSDSGTLDASNLNLTKSFYTITFKVNNSSYGSVSPTSLIVPNNSTKYTTSSNTLTLGDGRKVTATVKNASGYTTTFASWSPATGTITAATTVTANFDRTANSYTATFNSNGGTAATPATITKKYGEQLGTLPTTSRTGYTFAGWFTATSGGTQISASTTMPVNGATYYAHWNINQYTLTVNPNGGTWNNTTSNSSFKQNYGTTKDIPNPTAPKGYTVTFNSNGGNSIANQTSTKSFDKWSLSGSGNYVSSLSKPTTSGMTVTESSENGEKFYRFNYAANNPTSNTWYYSRFPAYTYTSGDTYEIKFKVRVNSVSNGGSITFRHSAVSNDYGTSGLKTKNFNSATSGWVDVSLERTISGTTTTLGGNTLNVAPVFEFYTSNLINTSASMNFDIKDLEIINKSKGTLLQSMDNKYIFGAGNGTLTANYKNNSITLPTPTKTGHTFAGWYTDSALSNKAGGAGEAYTPTANTTLYAKWTVNKYTLSVDPNGGTWNNTTEISSFEQNYGSTKNIPNPTAPSGFTVTFDGNNGTTPSAQTSNRTFSNWSKSGEGTFSNNIFTFGAGDGFLTANYNNSSITLPTSTRSGYEFIGWYTMAEGGTKIGDAGASYTPNENITLYAQWKDIVAPTIDNIKVITQTGVYPAGKVIDIRLQFSEAIKGTSAPTVKVKFGNGAEKTLTPKEITEGQNYIDYTITIAQGDLGVLTITSISGGNITDISGNAATITTVSNTGNTVTADTIGPLASIYEDQNTVTNVSRVSVDVADYETDVAYVELPDGTRKTIYDELRDNVKVLILEELTADYVPSARAYEQIIRQYFSNVTVDSSYTAANIANTDFDIVISNANVWISTKQDVLKAAFDAGKNVITIGNDSNDTLNIIENYFHVPPSSYAAGKNQLIENEITPKINYTGIAQIDEQNIITQLIDGADTWYTLDYNGNEYPAISLYEEHDTRWFHSQLSVVDFSTVMPYLIRKLTRITTASYEIPGPGTYTFKIYDQAGNCTEKTITTGNYKVTFEYNEENLKNGDFSDGLTNWSVSTPHATATLISYKGKKSVRFHLNGNVINWAGFCNNNGLVGTYHANTLYKISYMVYRDSTSSYGDANANFHVYCPEVTSDGVTRVDTSVTWVNPKVDVPDKCWTKIEKEFTTADGYWQHLYAAFDTGSSALAPESTLWLADFRVERIQNQTKSYGSTLGTLPTLSRSGYTFQGWYTAPEGGTRITESTKVLSGNVTYYAHWAKNSAPAKPSKPDLLTAHDTGFSNTDNATYWWSQLSLSGTAEAGSTLKLYRNNSLYGQTTVASNGTWSMKVDNYQNSWTSWVAYASNAAGTSPASDALSICSDISVPSISGLSATATSASKYRLNITASEAGGSGIRGYYVSTSSAKPSLSSGWAVTSATSYTFNNANPSTTYYVWVADNAGNISNAASITPQPINYSVNNTAWCTTFQQAVGLAGNGHTIYLLKNITDGSAGTINKNLTFTTNGHNLTRTASITVSSGRTVTITGSGTLTGNMGTLIYNAGTLNISHSGTISATASASNNVAAIQNNAGATLNKTGGGTIQGANIGIYSQGRVNMSAGTVTGTAGHALKVGTATGSVSMTGGTLSNSNSYGALCVYTSASAAVSGGTIRNYSSSALSTYGTTTISGSTSVIGANSGITVQSGILRIQGGTITGTNHGVINRGQCAISGGTIYTTGSNEAVSNGTGTESVGLMQISGGTIYTTGSAAPVANHSSQTWPTSSTSGYIAYCTQTDSSKRACTIHITGSPVIEARGSGYAIRNTSTSTKGGIHFPGAFSGRVYAKNNYVLVNFSKGSKYIFMNGGNLYCPKGSKYYSYGNVTINSAVKKYNRAP